MVVNLLSRPVDLVTTAEEIAMPDHGVKTRGGGRLSMPTDGLSLLWRVSRGCRVSRAVEQLAAGRVELGLDWRDQAMVVHKHLFLTADSWLRQLEGCRPRPLGGTVGIYLGRYEIWPDVLVWSCKVARA